jgi:hypothetical protein
MDCHPNGDHPADPDDSPQNMKENDEMGVILKEALHDNSFNSE